MYKIPDDINENFLKGDIVRMICFNSTQIYLHFDSSKQITIEGQYSFGKSVNKQSFNAYPVLSDNGLLNLIDKQVETVVISESRQDLSIYFQGDWVIELIGSMEYESYIIDPVDANRRIII